MRGSRLRWALALLPTTVQPPLGFEAGAPRGCDAGRAPVHGVSGASLGRSLSPHRRQVKLSEPIPEALVLSPLPAGEGAGRPCATSRDPYPGAYAPKRRGDMNAWPSRPLVAALGVRRDVPPRMRRQQRSASATLPWPRTALSIGHSRGA